MLKARCRNTLSDRYNYEVMNGIFNIYDNAGQRCERIKWIRVYYMYQVYLVIVHHYLKMEDVFNY